MKKRIMLMIMATTMLLTGCSNMSLGYGEYYFKKIHINTHDYDGCLTIDKWFNNEHGIEVKTKEVGSLFLSEGTYTLVEDVCPFCENNN